MEEGASKVCKMGGEGSLWVGVRHLNVTNISVKLQNLFFRLNKSFWGKDLKMSQSFLSHY